MNRKGQALVEFIIIVPIIIIIFMGICDFVMIFNSKSTLDNNLNEVIKIKNKEEIDEYIKNVDNKIKVEIKIEDKYKKIILSKEYKFITPGLNKIISSPFYIKSERVVLSE